MDKSTPELDTGVVSSTGWVLPVDVVVTVLFVVVSDVLLLSVSPAFVSLRAAIALPLVLLVPGYVLTAYLFPRRCSVTDGRNSELVSDRPGLSSAGIRRAVAARPISWTERLALSFGMSLALVPLLGLVIAPVAGSLSLEPVLVGLNLFILFWVVAGVVRRNGLPADERLRLPYRRWGGAVREAAYGGQHPIDRVISVFVLVTVLVSVVTMGFVLLAPQHGESYTSTTLLTERADGTLTASGYPSQFTAGQGEDLVLQIENSEDVETSYTVIVELQQVTNEEGSLTVEARDELLREQRTVAAGDTWRADHTVTPTTTGENLRVAYYVYRGDVPAVPAEDTAYRNLYFWTDVSESE